MVQLLDGQGDLPPDRRHPAPGPHRRGRPPHGRRADASTRRRSPSTSCWSTWPATTSAGSPRFGTEHVDELMTLERYSHVMHLTSQVSGDAGRGHAARSTCCGPRCRRAPSAAPRRCGPWRSSTSSSRPSGARTPASSATSTSRGNIDTAIAIRTMFVGPDGGASRAGRRGHRGRQRPRRTRTSSAATRPRRCSPPSRPPGG